MMGTRKGNNRPHIYERIENLSATQDKSPFILAEAAGLSVRSLRRALERREGLSAVHVYKIATCLGVSVDHLFEAVPHHADQPQTSHVLPPYRAVIDKANLDDLVALFLQIQSPLWRQRVIELMRAACPNRPSRTRRTSSAPAESFAAVVPLPNASID